MGQEPHPYEPASRIAIQIIQEAVQKHATSIRIALGEQLTVEYSINNESKIGMKLPKYIKNELFAWFKAKTKNGEMVYSFPPDAPHYYFEMQLDATETIMTLLVSKAS